MIIFFGRQKRCFINTVFGGNFFANTDRKIINYHNINRVKTVDSADRTKIIQNIQLF